MRANASYIDHSDRIITDDVCCRKCIEPCSFLYIHHDRHLSRIDRARFLESLRCFIYYCDYLIGKRKDFLFVALPSPVIISKPYQWIADAFAPELLGCWIILMHVCNNRYSEFSCHIQGCTNQWKVMDVENLQIIAFHKIPYSIIPETTPE